MRLARYHGGGVVGIEDEPRPELPAGGLVVRTEACGLCSGELMDWYMDQKVPHVLGHEVCGIVVESDSPRFAVGSRVFAHHHAPCMECGMCRSGRHVHCPRWKSTKLVPGGMAEYFAVSPENLSDTMAVDDLDPCEAALIEPLGCVAKSLRKASPRPGDRCAVVGLGFMGVAHLALLPTGSVGFDVNESRVRWARDLGLQAALPSDDGRFEAIVVCPGNEAALEFALRIAAPDARIVLFAPMPPGKPTPVDLNRLYFSDIALLNSFSCGPDDTLEAAGWLRDRRVGSAQLVSHFISLDELPREYQRMKRGEILKPMVLFE